MAPCNLKPVSRPPRVKIHQMHFARQVFYGLSWHHLQKVKIAEPHGKGNLSCSLKIMMNLLITCSNMLAGKHSNGVKYCLQQYFLAWQPTVYISTLAPLFKKINKNDRFCLKYCLWDICRTWYLSSKGCIDSFIWVSVTTTILREKKHWMVSQEGIAIYQIKSILTSWWMSLNWTLFVLLSSLILVPGDALCIRAKKPSAGFTHAITR